MNKEANTIVAINQYSDHFLMKRLAGFPVHIDRVDIEEFIEEYIPKTHEKYGLYYAKLFINDRGKIQIEVLDKIWGSKGWEEI